MTDKELWEKSQVWDSSDDGRGKLKILESVEKFAELVRADKPVLQDIEQEDDAVAALTEEGWMWDGDQWQRPAQPEQEPVATVQCINGVTIGYLDVMQPVGTKLYTAPPKREWVGLTPADFEKLEQLYGHQVSNDFAFANIVCQIEATLKEKNT